MVSLWQQLNVSFCCDSPFEATGTPGFPALLMLAIRDQLASLPLSDLAQPAIEIARDGCSGKYMGYQGTILGNATENGN